MFDTEEQRDERAVKRAAAAVFGCPVGVLTGVLRGHSVEVRCHYGGAAEHGGLAVWVQVHSNLYGATVAIVQRAHNYGPAPANTRFDPRLAVGGLPRSVLLPWIDASMQEACVRLRLFVHGGRDGLRLSLDTKKAADPAYLAAACNLGVYMVERLPHAIHAAGEGRYLELGSLSTHPEVVADKRETRRKRLVYGTLTIVISVALVAAMIAIAF
jgi:hypothetical protein